MVNYIYEYVNELYIYAVNEVSISIKKCMFNIGDTSCKCAQRHVSDFVK